MFYEFLLVRYRYAKAQLMYHSIYDRGPLRRCITPCTGFIDI